MIVTCFNCIFRVCYCVNIVEFVKLFSIFVYWLTHSRNLTDENKRSASIVGIDIFQFIKFGAIGCLLYFNVQDTWAKYVTYYLIASNAFTYFYYHAWGSEFRRNHDLDSQRRRLLNFLLAIVFYILCYAHLYKNHFWLDIRWPEDHRDTINAIYLSVANAFTLTYGGFSPLAQNVRVLFMTELANTFLFLITTQAKRNLSSRSGIGGVLSAT